MLFFLFCFFNLFIESKVGLAEEILYPRALKNKIAFLCLPTSVASLSTFNFRI